MIQSTKLAKAVYWLSGQLSRVHTPQRRFEMKVPRPGEVGDLDNLFTKLPGLTWSSCRWTWKVLGWAQALDHKHFDHWGLQHTQCLEGSQTAFCEHCKEYYCLYVKDEDDE